MSSTPKERNTQGHKLKASVVLIVTFMDKNVGTFYSYDANFPENHKNRDNIYHWIKHFRKLVEVTWKGRVLDAVMFRWSKENQAKTGDALYKNLSGNVIHTEC